MRQNCFDFGVVCEYLGIKAETESEFVDSVHEWVSRLLGWLTCGDAVLT